MFDFIIEKMHDPRLMTMLFAAIAAGATVFTLVSPLFADDGLNKRMRAVADERERIRLRERDRMAKSEKGFAAAVAEAGRAEGGRGFQPRASGWRRRPRATSWSWPASAAKRPT